ncbi:MAG TPA: alkaline phosphatase family protein [Candidatus Omnitrophota bacterium]|nr:alkaline phosphatase family protein [Candidatus Omnitrophota bacterium]
MHKKTPNVNQKVVILGIDGMSPEIADRMMSEGKLPHFSKLKAEGSYRRLSTTNPSQSPVAWAGFATGENPGKTNVFDFIVRDPKTYGLSLSLSKVEKGKARKVIRSPCFWEILSRKNIPATVIHCPVTFPPDKISGRMLSGMGVPDILGTEGTFTFYTSESIDKTKDIGGKVFKIRRSPLMVLQLIGPRMSGFSGKSEHAKVPFKVSLGKNSVSVECQGQQTTLKPGEWSDWQEVRFKAGFLRTIKGIFKFYLAELDPEFKLYISPINLDPRMPLFPISSPQSYSKKLAGRLGLYHTQGMPLDTWAVNERRLTEEAFLKQVDSVFNEQKALFDLEISRFNSGVLFFYFGFLDTIQHMFWRYTDPEHPLYEPNAPKEYKEMIETWYEKMDTVLGETMDWLKPDDILIVLSDHGFNTFRRAVHLNSWLRKNGYLELKDPSSEAGGELLQDIDWAKTKAYAIGFGAIYINQKGRERDGIVNPGEETERLKKEIAQKLIGWTDEKYQRPVLHKVYSREEIFRGPFADETPDLYAGFNIGYRPSWQTALGAVPELLLEDNLKKWSGSHLFDPSLIPGVLFLNRKIGKENPSIYDITPTILEIFGFKANELKDPSWDGTTLDIKSGTRNETTR